MCSYTGANPKFIRIYVHMPFFVCFLKRPNSKNANQNQKISQWGFLYLTEALNNCIDKIENMMELTNQMIFKTVYYVIEFQKFGNAKQMARNIIKFYLNKMGEDGFRRFLEHMINNQLSFSHVPTTICY